MPVQPAAGALFFLTVALLLTGTTVAVQQSSEDEEPATELASVGPRSAGAEDARPSRARAGEDALPPEGSITPIERAPAPAEPPPLEDFGEVTTQRAAVRVDGVTAADPLAAVLAHQSVRFATIVQLPTVSILGPDGQASTVQVAAVDPRGFRVLTPQVTADAQGVWQHIMDGHAVVDHAAAERLGVELGGDLPLPDGRPSVRVGAIAALGDAGAADVALSAAKALQLGLGADKSVLVSIAGNAQPSRVAAELADMLDARAVPLLPDRAPIELGRTIVGAHQWDDVWDRLAWCESSGRWHLDSGNGYYGGLQFLPSSWWWVGGSGMPHEASREEQIARAKILHAYQGWEAWPACSLALGFR